MFILNCGQRTYIGLRDIGLPQIVLSSCLSTVWLLSLTKGSLGLEQETVIDDQTMQSLPGAAHGKEPGR